ncbi:hypothetical protein C7S10_05160 [Nocardioides currus]|uniref:alpha-amylase n=2 Tax=Nocardioides currus TaxID=2133958 RepID=A0A2R7YYL9_9ACTN|nr:hypothetical protein C7S10_05160 [Nocardioides currus]
MGAGAALVAAGLSLGVMAPANAAATVNLGLIDGQGNPVSGNVTIYQQGSGGTFSYWGNDFVEASGYLETQLPDGVYKLSYSSGTYIEYYKDKADQATADTFTVSGTTAVSLGQWTIDQPYLTGTVTNAAGKPLAGVEVNALDAVEGDYAGTGYTNVNGVYKFPSQAAPVKVAYSANGYATEYYNDKGNFAEAEPVAATAAGAVLNVVLTAGGSISGQVTSDAGAPLEFIRVSSSSGGSDYTDKNGIYTIKNASVGGQTIQFSDPIGEYASELFNNITTTGDPTPVVVGPDQAVGNINANMTPKPADPSKTVELTGSVKDSLGAPIVGAVVSAHTTPGIPTDQRSVETVYSNRQGVYSFTELEKVQGENQFKVQAGADEQGDDDAFELFSTWFGGGQNYDGSPAVTVTPGTPVGAVDFVLDRAGGIAGSVTGIAGAPLSPSVSAFGPVDGQFASVGAVFEADSTFESRSIRPGTYKIRFDDNTGYHAGEWWKDKSAIDDAVLVTVKAGQVTSGLNAVLGNKLAATERPEIPGYPWVGKPVTADPGAWNLQTDTAFKYQWLVGTTVVGQGDTFTPTSAQIGDRLTLRVTAENGRLVGTATSAPSAKIGYQPKVKVKVKGGQASFKVKASPVKAKKVKGSIVVKEIVKVTDNGTVKYKKVAKAKIKKGKGAVSLGKLKKGKHKLVFFFTGKGSVGSTEVAKKVKVKR